LLTSEPFDPTAEVVVEVVAVDEELT